MDRTELIAHARRIMANRVGGQVGTLRVMAETAELIRVSLGENNTFYQQLMAVDPIEYPGDAARSATAVLEALIAHLENGLPAGISPKRQAEIDVVSDLDTSSLEEAESDYKELIQELTQLRNLMVSVSTGGPRIQDKNEEYRRLYEEVDQRLRSLNISNPNPYRDLWDWYGKWSSGDLPSYQSRRQYIGGLFAPLEERLRNRDQSAGKMIFREPTGWPLVDRQLGEIRKRLEEASTEEQYQAVGLLCRETMISLAQTVYDSTRHPTVDGTAPSPTDAKRMLDAYFAVELAGSANEAARKHAKTAFDFANIIQHRRTTAFREAALCAEATSSVVNTIAIVSGRRDPYTGPSPD